MESILNEEKQKVKNEMRLEFDSKSVNESFARSVVSAFISQLDPTIDELADIKTAVSEAVTNAIIHAYPNRDGIVKIHSELYEDSVKIEILDNGIGIENIKEAREPLFTTKGNMERSGMGFTIMESFMDKLEIESVSGVGTKIILYKKFKKDIL